MNTVIGFVMAWVIGVMPLNVATPRCTMERWYLYGNDYVSVRETTVWPLGDTIVNEYEISYDEWISE